MQRRKRAVLGAALVVVVGLLLPAAVLAVPDGEATVRFGNPDAGNFDPEVGGNASFNAQDNLIPRTVTISAGGSVTYEIAGPHQPMVYEPGVRPSDIDVPAFPPNFFIDDDEGLKEPGPFNVPPGTTTWTTDADTFDEPGKYLVLCNVTPHFAFANMYGWVIVK